MNNTPTSSSRFPVIGALAGGLVKMKQRSQLHNTLFTMTDHQRTDIGVTLADIDDIVSGRYTRA